MRFFFFFKHWFNFNFLECDLAKFGFGSIFWYCRISSELCFLRWALYVFCDPHRRQSVVNNVMGFWMILRVFILNDEVEAVTADSLILYKCPRSGSGSAWIIISPLDCITAPTLSYLFPDSMACKETLDQPRLAGVELSFSKKNVFLISVIRIKGFQKLDPQLHPTLKLTAYDL